uniref:Uncharacterized protein n=1 Tax=Rhizophora mucronata TaxID=61149 RepID=A0A2P2JZU8_RHIMU
MQVLKLPYCKVK